MKIQTEVLKTLEECTIKENLLFLPNRQLERKEYTDINKVLCLMGGKWQRSKKAHEFSECPQELLETVILTEEITDKKKELNFFETPEKLVKQMIALADIKKGDSILEPSAGKGAIIKHIDLSLCLNLTMVEIDRECCDYLRQNNYENHRTYNVKEMDFLEYEPSEKFDKIIMNPPFARNQDIKHFKHAYNLLSDGGIIVSILSEHPFFANDKLSIEFRQFLEDTNAEIIKNDNGAFKESGTMVNTRIIKIKK